MQKSSLWALTVLCVSLLVGGMSWFCMNMLIQDTERVTQSHLILENSQEMLLAVVDIESAKRGFVITGNERFLSHYNQGLKDYKKSYAKLLEITSDNPTQHTRVVMLAPIAEDKIEFVQAIVKAVRLKKKAEAISLINSGRGEATMETFRALMSQIQSASMKEIQDSRSVVFKTQMTLLGLISIVVAYALFIHVMASKNQTDSE